MENTTPKKDEKKQKGPPRKKMTYYGLQLQEKQKAKRIYGMRERQFRRFFALATKEKGDKGATLIELLERRLDNVVFRLGWAATRRMARQMITHGHLKVNGKKVDIPSFLVSVDDKIEFKSDKMPKLAKNMPFKEEKIEVPKWLAGGDLNATVKKLPVRKDIDVPIKENLIVELYSK